MKVFFFILCLVPTTLSAQEDLKRRADIIRFADGVIYTYSSPLRWKQKDWLMFGGVLAGTAAVSLLDEPIRKFWKSTDSKILDGIEEVGFHYGKPYSAFAFTGGFYLAGLLLDNRWSKDTGIMLGTTLLTSGLLQTLSKDAFGRARPDTEEGPYSFQPFSGDAKYHSFPSGHFAVAMGISLIVARRTDILGIKILFYSLAASTLISRMYVDAHWFSDMSFGGTLAWFCANAAIQRIENNQCRKKNISNKVSLKVYPYPGGLTLRASL